MPLCDASPSFADEDKSLRFEAWIEAMVVFDESEYLL